MINFEKLEKEKIAVLFDTREEMKDFLKECEKSDMLWRSGVKATERNPFDCYNEYCITVGFEEEKCLEYASEEFYESKGYKIVNYKNLIKSFTKEDLEDGDICTLRNGNIAVYNHGLTSICLRTEQINDGLTNNRPGGTPFDIVKVERPVKYETVFEREEEPTELTISEIKEKFGITGLLKIKEDE